MDRSPNQSRGFIRLAGILSTKWTVSARNGQFGALSASHHMDTRDPRAPRPVRLPGGARSRIRRASSAVAAAGSSASVMARTTTTRRAPASRTSSRFPASMPPMANHGRSWASEAAYRTRPRPGAYRPGLVGWASRARCRSSPRRAPRPPGPLRPRRASTARSAPGHRGWRARPGRAGRPGRGGGRRSRRRAPRRRGRSRRAVCRAGGRRRRGRPGAPAPRPPPCPCRAAARCRRRRRARRRGTRGGPSAGCARPCTGTAGRRPGGRGRCRRRCGGGGGGHQAVFPRWWGGARAGHRAPTAHRPVCRCVLGRFRIRRRAPGRGASPPCRGSPPGPARACPAGTGPE